MREETCVASPESWRLLQPPLCPCPWVHSSLATRASATSYSVTCAKLAVKNGTATASKCSPTSGSWSKTQKKEFKTLSGSVNSLAGGGSLTWAPGSGVQGTGTVTISPPVVTSPAGVCPTKDTAIQADGTITGQVDPVGDDDR